MVGAGGVGSSIVSITARRDVFEQIVVADVDAGRANRAAARTGSPRVIGTRVDASDRIDLVELARTSQADVFVNACDPRFNPPIFDTHADDGQLTPVLPLVGDGELGIGEHHPALLVGVSGVG